MAGERRFVISISGEDRGASETLRRTSREADKLGKAAKSSSASTGALVGAIGGALPGAAGRATSALGGLGGNATLVAGSLTAAAAAGYKFGFEVAKAASDVQEQVAAVGQTFTTSAPVIVAWSKTTAESIGISQVAALKAANAFGGMFTNLGFTAQKSAEMSQAAVQLAGDLASFKNIGVEEALEKIRSGLAGEAEPLRSLGVFLSEAGVQARGMADGLANAKGELSQTAKVATRFQLILEQTTKAQGDAARTSESFANAQRRMAASSDDLKASVGAKVLPALNDVTLGAEATLRAVSRLTGDGEGGLGSLGEGLLVGSFLGTIGQGLRLVGKQAEQTLNPVQRLAEAQSVYARVVIDGKEGTDAGREAKVAYQKAVREAEAATGRLAVAFESEEDAAKKAQKATEDHAKALDDAQDSVFGLASAERSMAEAADGIVDADEAVIDAQEELNRLRREGAVDAKEVERAEKSLADAARSVADAREAEADAERDLAEARQAASAFDLRGGELDFEEAGLAWKDATRRAEEAKKALDEARSKGMVGPELGDLERDLARALLAVERAERDVIRSDQEMQALRQQGTAQDERVIEAEERVRDARERVKEATDRRREAEADLRTAQAGDPEFADKLAAAADKVTDAQERAKDARWRAVEAAVALQGAAEKEAEALAATGDAAGVVRDRIDELIRRHPQLAAVLGTVRALIHSPGTTAASEMNRLSESDTARPRAAGGTMEPGGRYLVGEGGQTEIISMGRGKVTPIGRNGTAVGGVTNHFTINLQAHGVSDADALVREFGPKMLDWLRLQARRSGPLGLEAPFGR